MRYLFFIYIVFASTFALSAQSDSGAQGTVDAGLIFDGDMATVMIYGDAAKLLKNLISEKKQDRGITCSKNDVKTKSTGEFKCWFLVNKTGEVASPGSK